jgi:DNA-binding NarL/FixJ family response regulator
MLAAQGHSIRVMLAILHRLSLSGLQRLIDDQNPRLSVVGTASCSSTALEVAGTVKPDVVVLDVNLLDDEDDELVPSLINGSRPRVLILGDSKTRKLYEAAIRQGACGVLDKSETAGTLIKAIEKVHAGELWLDRLTTQRLFVELSTQKNRTVADPDKQKIAALTAREREVLRILVKDPGAQNKTLASNMHIGEHTLRNHLSRIYDKLGVQNRLELYLFAQRQGINDRATVL